MENMLLVKFCYSIVNSENVFLEESGISIYIVCGLLEQKEQKFLMSCIKVNGLIHKFNFLPYCGDCVSLCAWRVVNFVSNLRLHLMDKTAG